MTEDSISGSPAQGAAVELKRTAWQRLSLGLWAASRGYTLGAIVLIVFIAGILQLGRIGSLATPAESRANNGTRPTFFAVHLNPYYLFSEDFHLYVVRGKRIASRGWSDSLWFASDETGKNYAAPLQAALGMIAAQTGGEPWRYALFLCTILTISWLLIYGVARRALPTNISPLNILLAVLVTVLFESLTSLTRPHTEFYQWPVHRSLRMSTFAWSNPLLVAVLLAGGALAFRRRSPTLLLAFLAAALLILSLSDNWAFMLAWGGTGLSWLLVVAGCCRRGPLAARRTWLLRMSVMALILLTTLTSFGIQTGFLRGDALSRGGMGPQWQTPGAWLTPTNQKLIWQYAVLMGVALATCAMVLHVRIAGWSLRATIWVAGRGWARRQMQVAALAWMPIVAMIAIVATISWVGTDPYHARQFQWRADYCILFAASVLVFEAIRRGIVRRMFSAPRARWLELASAAVCVAALLGYHQYRIDRFLKNTAAREYFLTQDAEGLHDWLAQYSAGKGRFSLATASHELNLLCAYWTDADLWLPSGFPYHCGSSREQLETRTADVMRLYNVSGEKWLDFNLHMHADDQWSWGQSRVLSARQGYMYYLLHREVWIKGYPSGLALGQFPFAAPKGSTERIAQMRALHRAAYVSAAMKSLEVDESKEVAARLLADRAAQSPSYEWLKQLGGQQSWSPRGSVEAAERIAARIESLDRPLPTPDVIIIDDVSRALGMPDLSAYELAFRSPSIEAWVRSVPQGNFASRPKSDDRRGPH